MPPLGSVKGEKKKGGDERGQGAQGQGLARVHQNSVIRHALKGMVVLRGAYVDVCASVLVLRASRVVASLQEPGWAH